MTKKDNLHIYPGLVCIITPVTFLITFAISISLGHVNLLPYISSTGNRMPESCIFSQFLNITALLLLICVYVRYLQVKTLATFKTRIGPQWNANSISWYMGFFSCMGIGIVANFQVQNIYQVHYIGALLCFVGGSFYFVFQTIFSYHMSKIDDSKYLFYIRCILCAISALMCTGAIGYGILSELGYDGVDPNIWTVGDGGYEWHIMSAGCEWMLAITQSILVLTFLPEFKRISIYSPKLEIIGIHDVQNNQNRQMTRC